jgi:hypothetical protein
MQKYEYLIQPQIALVESSKDFIPKFPLGENLANYTGPSQSEIKVFFNVKKEFSMRMENAQKFHYFRGLPRSEEVYYERPIGFGLVLKLHVMNILDKAILTVNETYYRFIRLRINAVFPPGVHLADILSVNLLAHGYSPAHCAAISSDNQGILLFAPPDTGKTLTTLSALKRGFHYLAEDIAFVDKEYVYANPHTTTFLHNEEYGAHQVRKSPLRKVPFLSSYARSPSLSMSNIVQNFKVENKAPIRKIIILDRGSRSVEKIHAADAKRRMLIINRNEFSYHKNALLFAYSYFNESLDITKLMKAEEDLIGKIASERDCYLVKSYDPREYIELVMDVLK